MSKTRYIKNNYTYTNKYIINQQTLVVIFKPMVVSLDFTPYSSLDLLYRNCKSLIIDIKTDYRNFYQKDLEINYASFMAEIWGHLVVYRIALWMKKYIRISFIQKLAKFAAFRSGVIDCGEAKIDTNRWFWDIIGWVFFRKYS